MKKYVIIVAGGSGSRMGAEVPKQFLLLGNKPVLMHTINVFKNYDSEMELILVLPEDQFEYWESLCKEYSFKLNVKLAPGGRNRFYSVKNGLALITEPGVVGIHDGVRPFVSLETIEKCYHKASIFGAAIPVRDMHESLRFSDGSTNYAVDRRHIKIVQTPQVFKTDVVMDAYNQDYKEEEFYDDASVVERNGVKIQLVSGNRENIKITTPFDLQIGTVLIND